MSTYKVVFSDIDGTLLTSEHIVSTATIEAIASLQDKNIPFVIISSRSASCIYPILEKHHFQCPIVACGGAWIEDMNGRILSNEGEIAGYAKEITDYIPEGLRFVQEDNPDWYTREPLNGKERVATKLLENTLLQPGESATVSILLTWINGQDNMGLKTNIAEISQDYNDSNTPDIDSVPDNFKEDEDDIDDAPVMLTVALGDAKLYIGIAALVVIALGGGVFIIKKYVI